MEEIQLYNEKGEVKGKESIDKIHNEGYLYGSTQSWIIIKENLIILEKRSLSTKLFSGLYGPSSAGHITYGLTPMQNTIRETKEELNIDVSNAKYIKDIYRSNLIYKKYIVNELIFLFFYKTNFEMKDIYSSKEIQNLYFLTFEDLKELYKNNKESFIPYGRDYYDLVFEKLEILLKNKEI